MGTIHSGPQGCSQGNIFSRRSSRESQHKGDRAHNHHNPLTEKISSESRSDVPSQLSPSAIIDDHSHSHSQGSVSSENDRSLPPKDDDVTKTDRDSSLPKEDIISSTPVNPNEYPEETRDVGETESKRDEANGQDKTDGDVTAETSTGENKPQDTQKENDSKPSKQQPLVKIHLIETPAEEERDQDHHAQHFQDGEITPENDVEHNLSPNLSTENVSTASNQSRSFPNLTISTSKSPSTSPLPSPSAPSSSSRFSFFKGIQSVIHVNRWIKKTHPDHASESGENGAKKDAKKEPAPMTPNTLKEFEETYEAEPPVLTPRQKELLRSSWHEIGNDISQVGVIAFTGLFDSHPDVQDSFLSFKGLASSDLSDNATLREHALRVMTTVEKFVHRMDVPEKMQTILEDLGKGHFQYRIKVDYIRIVGTEFVRAVKPHVAQWTPEMEDAWMTMIAIMTFHMTRGILDTHQELLTS